MGLSIANFEELVYMRRQIPLFPHSYICILSNWKVLYRQKGSAGDVPIQPAL